jgi:hypothetical protein
MRPGLHRYHPDLHPTRRLPAFRVVRSHRRPRSGWPPWAAASVMILLGVTGLMVTLAASRGPTVGPVRTVRPPVAGVPLVPQQVASDPPVGQGDDASGQEQQRGGGSDQASRSAPRGTDGPGLPDEPGTAAATAPASTDPSLLLLPVPTSPPPMAVPSPSLTPTGPGCGRKPPHPTRSPKRPVEIVASVNISAVE